jgi:hypothetical protein
METMALIAEKAEVGTVVDAEITLNRRSNPLPVMLCATQVAILSR